MSRLCLKSRSIFFSMIVFLGFGGLYSSQAHAEQREYSHRAVSPELGGPRAWRVSASKGLNLRSQASTASKILLKMPEGQLLDNLGCEQVNSLTWCDVQPFGGGPRGYASATFLRPAVSPDGTVAMGLDDSALRAGEKSFDATGMIPCAQLNGQPTGACPFGVSRSGGGYATVLITKPDGSTRAIFFRLGLPTGANTSQAEGYPEFNASRSADLNFIRVGQERYEIPDAVIYGG